MDLEWYYNGNSKSRRIRLKMKIENGPFFIFLQKNVCLLPNVITLGPRKTDINKRIITISRPSYNSHVGESYALMRAKLSLVRKIRCSRTFAFVCVRKFMKMFQNLFDFCSFSTFSIVFLVQKVCFQTLLPS
jgi:hypothetical protein